MSDSLKYWQDLACANRKVAEDNQTKLAAAQAQRDEKDKQLADCYDRMCKAEARSNLLACALRSLLSKCTCCGGTGEVATGLIQMGIPSLTQCFVCAGERGILLKECGK